MSFALVSANLVESFKLTQPVSFTKLYDDREKANTVALEAGNTAVLEIIVRDVYPKKIKKGLS